MAWAALGHPSLPWSGGPSGFLLHALTVAAADCSCQTTPVVSVFNPISLNPAAGAREGDAAPCPPHGMGGGGSPKPPLERGTVRIPSARVDCGCSRLYMSSGASDEKPQSNFAEFGRRRARGCCGSTAPAWHGLRWVTQASLERGTVRTPSARVDCGCGRLCMSNHACG